MGSTLEHGSPVERDSTNRRMAEALRRMSELLAAQGANQYRVRAYARGADSIDSMETSVRDVLQQGGLKALIAIPAVGETIAAAVAEYVQTGHLRSLDRLEGKVAPESLFTTIPGIGETLAHAIHEELHVETLEELEAAAHDGRLARVPGFGARRVRALQESLGFVLSHSARRRARLHPPAARRQDTRLSIAAAFHIDSRYRRLARADALPRIAPRRFNPSKRPWLPVLHIDAEGHHVTAMFSNTATAHQLKRTSDWVVLVAEKDGHEHQFTVVTEHKGPLKGKRVVRGREAECAVRYAQVQSGAA